MSHGLYLPRLPNDDPPAELRRELAAWLLVLPESARFTHVTGARLLGWRLPQLPEQVPVFVAVAQRDARPRRPGLICSRLVGEPRATRVAGVPVEVPEEILLRAARDLGVLDLVVMVDSALERGDLDPARLGEVLASRRPGVRVLRQAYALASSRSESAGESLLRVFHHVIEVPVQAQVDLHDDGGHPVGRADLLVTGTGRVHEYDGRHHRDARQHRTDLRRERAWAGTTYRRAGYTLDDLLNHPAATMHEMDRALGRPHRAGRIERWRALVRDSLYDGTGRSRVLNRWRRDSGATGWPRSA